MLPMHVSSSTSGGKEGNGGSSTLGSWKNSFAQGPLTGVLSCLMYTFCSVSMVLANKAIPMTVTPELRSEMPQVSVLLFQCLMALLLVEIARALGYADYQNCQWSIAKQWLPVNLLFISMLVTGFLSLVHASVPMVTIFKNLTNLITVSGDYYLYNEEVSNLTIVSILVMTSGAVLAGMNDLEFTWAGYFWMSMNCISTSGYVLYTKYATANIKLSKLGMVYYNNLLSSLLLIPVCLFLGEWSKVTNTAILTPAYLISNTLAGFLGFYLNFASLWCIGVTSATTYAIVGSLNKVPITILGFILFDAKMTAEGIAFVALATLGGFLYAYSKLPKK